MNLIDMISKMNPEMLSKGLKQVSPMLSPEQISQMEKTIKSMDKGALNDQLNNLSGDDLKKELENNPNLAKTLASNPELMSNLVKIFKKGK